MGKPRTIKAWAGAWNISPTRVMIDPGLVCKKRSDARQHSDLVVPVTITYDPTDPTILRRQKRKKKLR